MDVDLAPNLKANTKLARMHITYLEKRTITKWELKRLHTE